MSYYNNAQAYPGYAEVSPPPSYGAAQGALTSNMIANTVPNKPVKPDKIYVAGLAMSFPSPGTAFACAGAILLGLLMLVPIWSASALLHHTNYTFWASSSIPKTIIIKCVAVLCLYVFTMLAFFRNSRRQVQTEHTVMMIASVFVLLLGLVLIVSSLPMIDQANATYNDLMYHCGVSMQTHRVYEYSQVLQNIRTQPECAEKLSVTECAGYQEAPPYTNYLKALEDEFQCSGFCYQPASVTVVDVVAAVTANAASNGSEACVDNEAPMSGWANPTCAEQKAAGRCAESWNNGPDGYCRLTCGHCQPEAAPVSEASTVAFATSTSKYPPTLFSDRNFQASCNGMAARDMKNFVGNIGEQIFYEGVYLVAIVILTNFLYLGGSCRRKEREVQNDDLDFTFKDPSGGHS